MRLLLLGLLCSSLTLPCDTQAIGAARRADAERALVETVRKQEPAAVALLEQIVNVNSGTMNFAGVKQVADILRPRFEALGFDVR